MPEEDIQSGLGPDELLKEVPPEKPAPQASSKKPEPGSWFDPDNAEVTNPNIQRVRVLPRR